MIKLTDLYNHNSFMQSVAEGKKIINSNEYKTACVKAHIERKQAIKNFKVGDIVEIDNCKIMVVDGFRDDNLTCSSVTKTYRIKKNTSIFVNPCHITKIIK